MNRAELARFLRRVHKVPDGCWLWTGPVMPNGYGKHRLGPGHPERAAHRLAYEHHVGPVPDGLQLDHLCRNRRCVNPAHLEPVTAAVNTMRQDNANRRKTVCPKCQQPYPPPESDGRRRCPCRRHPASRSLAAR